ncbi:Na+/H+ antiporter NhaC family protein [Kaistella flava (ex Peng et al. 2021)]|uniref:Na+/H+ antiporter NhaC family protein n=1 Tax=Kaistella flava (ex Peng et al. 2021) TaxID=2038776 RepID=A0A7M2Y765_9FLAO|nr:Na+/H+ antiporter NhaC family protein [Kaistella flava (ex Peng et al. 2021)]QOW09946.1 Na+/H+ antiporter NhaC family protein [Kaistella flava (ex Peng et al. 2021)]
MTKTNGSFTSIIPLLIFVFVFLGAGIYNQDFYALPSPVAALIGIVFAFILLKGKVNKKIDTFLKGCGDGKILTMCIIYLLAGAFATVSKATGSVDTIVNLGLNYISAAYFPVGIFVIASFLSFASGTSVGSIVTLGPIVIELAEKSGSPLGLIGAALLSGAIFGDNLSVISDTTIAATQSLGCAMKDKFRVNFKLALPAAIIAIIILVAIGFNQETTSVIMEQKNFNFMLILPYLLVITLSIIGINVFVVLFSGLLFAGLLGMGYGTFGVMDFAKNTYEGFTSMTEIFLLSLLTGGLAALVEKAGGINFLLRNINKIINSQKTALLGIGGLVSVANFCVANNTIAILISGKVSKEITDKYDLKPQESASVLDIFACYVQGIIPYGAQILLLISLSNFKMSYTDLVLNSFYLHLLLVITLGSIIFRNTKKFTLNKSTI